MNRGPSFEGAGFGTGFAPLPVEGLCPEVALIALNHNKNTDELASPGGVGTLLRVGWRPALSGDSAATQLWPDVKMRIAL